MKICAIICEYNPFHRGHAWQLTQARKRSGADYVICLMSGAFVQRGEAAIVDKWQRAKTALQAGADAVFELPVLFSMRAAPDFARGGVSLALALGCSDLSFGCETDDLTLIRRLSSLDTQNNPLIHSLLAEGLSYPRALEAFYQKTLGAEFVMQPNLLLAVEYLRANQNLSGNLNPVPVLRTHPHDAPGLGAYASASAIRNGLLNALPEAFEAAGVCLNTPLVRTADLENVILWKLRETTPEQMRKVVDISEGLENRILSAALTQTGWQELIMAAGCARYTNARIRRAVLSAVLSITKELNTSCPTVPYARLLGFKRSSSPLLAQLKQQSTIPIYTKMANAPSSPCLDLDIRAQNLFDLALGIAPGRDMTTSPIIIP